MVTKFYTDNDKKPCIAKPGDAGIDLCYKGKEFFMAMNFVYKMHTGIYVAIPEGYCGIVFERSGLGSKYGVTVHGRVIDSGYRGEIIVLMSRYCTNVVDTDKIEEHGDKWKGVDNVGPFIVKPGDRIAQMVIVPFIGQLEEVAGKEDLGTTVRGETGLGSTGTK
jgi:dUTP pyrophosphatase